MLFNSFEFAVFLPIVFLLYWYVFNSSITSQNFLLVISSYFFYGWWDWKFLFLIILSTVSDYLLALQINNSSSKTSKKIFLYLSVGLNLGILITFKYFNFFLNSIITIKPGLSEIISFNALNIILPVGISFYTFQTLSYTIDVYRNKIKPTKNFLAFTAFVSFFPQLVAGPIERATHLLPQFTVKRNFNYEKAIDGLRQILWGLFKKMVIADNCAYYANLLFENPDHYSGSNLLLGVFFFSIQIYCDFSGYSDIAIGTARLFGFDLMQNFAFPYFSKSIPEFWRRWHISLSTWFRDYLYIPLGGSKVSKIKIVRNIFIVFTLSGMWHGANWTFICWGILNAIYFLPSLSKKFNNFFHGSIFLRTNIGKAFMSLSTFFLILISWIFFRAENISRAFQYIHKMFSEEFFSLPSMLYELNVLKVLFFISLFLIIEWIGRKKLYAIETLGKSWKKTYRIIFYYSIVIAIIWFQGKQQHFIYFQF